MKWNEEEDKKKPEAYIKVFVCISRTLSLSLLPLLLLSLYMHTHTHTEHRTKNKSKSVSQERGVVLLYEKMSFTNLREKNAKRCLRLFQRVKGLEKKDLLFPSVCAVNRAKKIFSDEMRWTQSAEVSLWRLSSLFTTSHHDGSLFFDSGSAREQSRFAQGTINERALLFRLCALSFIVVVSHVRALLAEEYKREIIFPVKFYHLSLCKREEHSRPKREEKGLQNAFFYAEEDTSRDVNEDLFEREWTPFSWSRVWFSDRRFYVCLTRKRARWWDDDEKSTSYIFGKDQISLGSTFHSTRSLRLLSVSNRPSNWPKSSSLFFTFTVFSKQQH